MSDDPEELEELPHREQIDPYVGYKHVTLSLDRGSVQISGNWRKVTLDDTAQCHTYPKSEPEHAAPHLGCKCGFHAYAEPVRPSELSPAVATVELFGYVIRAERGYRASRQRILALALDDCCLLCAKLGDYRYEADAAYFASNGDMVTLCAAHGEVAVRQNAAMRMTPAEIGSKLGVEVKWAR